jgi:hypothetical protein
MPFLSAKVDQICMSNLAKKFKVAAFPTIVCVKKAKEPLTHGEKAVNMANKIFNGLSTQSDADRDAH